MKFCASKFWDADLLWYTEAPDFTKCFQETVLAWVPFCLILLMLPWKYNDLRNSKRWKIQWNTINITQCVVTAFLGALYTGRCCWMALLPENTTAQILSNIMMLLTEAFMLIIRIAEKKRGLISTSFATVLWFVTFLCELVKYRSAINQIIDSNQTEVDIFDMATTLAIFPLTTFMFCGTFVADQPKSNEMLKSDINNIGNIKSKSSFLSKMFFLWAMPMVRKGYEGKLTQDWIWSLNRDVTAKVMYKEFLRYWKYNTDGTELKNTKRPVLMVITRMFWKPCFYGCLCRAIGDISQLMNPFMLNLLIELIENGKEPTWHGIIYSFGLLIACGTRYISFVHSYDQLAITAANIKAVLMQAIFNKALRLSNESKVNLSLGGMINLMAVDSQKFTNLLPLLPVLVNSGPLFVAAIYLLWGVMGSSCFAGLAALLIISPASAYIMSLSKKIQSGIMQLSDERLKITNEILTGIKILKLYAWEIPFCSRIRDIRSEEIKNLRKNAVLEAITSSLWSNATVLIGLASYTTYVFVAGPTLSPNVAFVSLALFNIIRTPLIQFPRAISAIVEVIISKKRLDNFLNSKELDMDSIHHTGEVGEVSVKNSSFTWSDGGPNYSCELLDINLTIKPGSLIAIVGKVGSGKSSLLAALLGEMKRKHGSTTIQGSVAYVPQQAWIQNATVQRNILFYCPLNVKRYNEVVEACALGPDFDILLAGDQTAIGDKGVNLSGGQKQRVSIARAVYNDADIYVMDDPLSAVDVHVGKHIFDHVIGPSGRLWNKTRIVSTNSLTYLSKCDNILVMKNGTISECGTYKKLCKSDGEFSEVLLNYLRHSEDSISTDDDEVFKDILDDASDSLKRKLSKSMSQIHASKEHVTANKEIKKYVHCKTPKSSQKAEEETMEVGSVKAFVYIRYLKQVGVFFTSACIIFWLCFISLIVMSSNWLSEWANESLIASYQNDTNQRNYRVGIYAILATAQVFSLFSAILLVSHGALRATHLLHNSMLDNIIHAPMSFFDTTPTGRIMNRFSKDVNVMDVSIVKFLSDFLNFAFMLLSSVIIIAMQVPFIIGYLGPAILLYIYTQKMYLISSRQLKRMESVTRSPIYSFFSEVIAGTSSVRAYNTQSTIIREFETNVDRNQKSFYSLLILSRWMECMMVSMATLLIFFTAIFTSIFKDTIGAGQAGLAISFAITASGAIIFTLQNAAEVENNIISGERILEYTNISREADWILSENKISPNWPSQGAVTFVDYETKYGRETQPVLKGINFHIDAGEKIGICGRTGAGKSSLTMALFRILERTSGSIIVDGLDISSIGLHDLRSKLTIIPQDPILFDGSLRFNIDPFNRHSDEEVWRVLELSHLKDFAMKFAEGLTLSVTEGGENVSVGQRQLICLARALLRKTKILILDEATASVDLETDDLIQKTIRKEFKDCTVLTIAHRLNTILDSTKVMVLSDGLVAEFDQPHKLLAKSESLFHHMLHDSTAA
ncbi:ABCC2 (predicted) [Pycnogonum litorale]